MPFANGLVSSRSVISVRSSGQGRPVGEKIGDVFGQNQAVVDKSIDGSAPAKLVVGIICIEPGELRVAKRDHFAEGGPTSAAR
jgi:hypothetical protein